jgi:small subunit ribosomal protein S13
MARVAGINLPKNKRLPIGLTYIKGIGRTRAEAIIEKLGLEGSRKIETLTEDELKLIREEVAQFTVEGDLRRDVAMNIKRKQEIGCYQGFRHKRGLPVRGQNTRTNARGRKGKKRTVANKKKVSK